MTRRQLLGRAMVMTLAPCLHGSTGWAVGPAALGDAQPSADEFPQGVFVASPQGPVELIAYAERTTSGQMRMAHGTFEDIPAVGSVVRFVCNLEAWRPVAVWLSTRAIFRNEFAERRQLRTAVGQVNVYAVAVRAAQIETAEGAARLVRQVRASEDNPAYVFLTMTNGSVARDYVLALTGRAER